MRFGRPRLLLEIDLTRPRIEVEPDNLPGKLRARQAVRWRRLIAAVHDAATDPQVAGLIATIGGRLALAEAQELREAVATVTAAGKPTWAWADTFGEAGDGGPAYLLATGFRQVWLQPTGSVGVVGAAAEVTFLRGALDRLGVLPQLGQRHEYKSAGDRLMREEFTPAHEEMVSAIADSAYQQVVDAICAGRDLDRAAVVPAIDRAPLNATAAIEAGLIDQAGYRDEVYDAAFQAVGSDTRLQFAEQWTSKRRRGDGTGAPALVRAVERLTPQPPAVALVDVLGIIAQGRSRHGLNGPVSGSVSVAAQLRATADDSKVGAVVLRVNSPGGSAVASDTIWHEVRRVRAAGKPVVVSMATLAASGGYFVSCGADAIVAEPATLTGSIGVVGGKLVVSELLERVGITTGAVQRGEHARLFSVRRPFDEEEWQHVDAWLDEIYADFVAKVAAGRSMSVDAVGEVARGRVWTGADAVDRGLVDELGGLRRAVGLARDRAGLPVRAAVRPAVRLPLAARLRPPKSSRDPRSGQVGGWSLAEVATTAMLDRLAQLPAADPAALLMPGLRLSC